MQITQRQVTLLMLAVLWLGASLVDLILIFTTQFALLTVVATVAAVGYGSLLFAYWRGWEPARNLVVISVVGFVVFSLVTPGLINYVGFIPMIPVVVAVILVSPAWVTVCAVIVLASMVVRNMLVVADETLPNLVVFGIVVSGMILARLVTDTAQTRAVEQTRLAEEALRRSEAQSAELSQKASELVNQNDEQRRLIELVATLETPAIALAEGVLLAPVVGHLDSRRITRLTERLLHEVNASRARLVILDIAGVAVVDTGVAHALLRAVQAVRLLGSDVTITGISASIAATITQLGITLVGVRTARTPQEALALAVVSQPVNGARKN